MRRLLIVRTDAIGDAILWNGALPLLRRALPGVRIRMVCRDAAAAIYETCEEIDELTPVDVRALADDASAVDALAAELNAWEADAVLHPTRSRERVGESLIARLATPEKIAPEMDLANATAEQRGVFDAGYTRILPSPGAWKPELHRHADVLRGFGVEGAVVEPRVVLTRDDRAKADALFAEFGASPQRTLVLTPAARWPIRLYPRWGEAVSMALAGRDDVEGVIALGGADARDESRKALDAIAGALPGLRLLDATGRTDVRTTVAVIERSRACAGNETFTMHAACAVGTPNAVLLGGGHFGRFMPYDGATVAAALPLDCFGCDWRCRFDRPVCVRDVPVEVVALAIGLALDGPAARPRVVVPGGAGSVSDAATDGPGRVEAEAVRRWLGVEVKFVEAAGGVEKVDGAGAARLTVSASRRRAG